MQVPGSLKDAVTELGCVLSRLLKIRGEKENFTRRLSELVKHSCRLFFFFNSNPKYEGIDVSRSSTAVQDAILYPCISGWESMETRPELDYGDISQATFPRPRSSYSP